MLLVVLLLVLVVLLVFVLVVLNLEIDVVLVVIRSSARSMSGRSIRAQLGKEMVKDARWPGGNSGLLSVVGATLEAADNSTQNKHTNLTGISLGVGSPPLARGRTQN